MAGSNQQGRFARYRAAVSIGLMAGMAGLIAGNASASAQVSAATGPPSMGGDSYLLGITGPGGVGAPTGGVVLPLLYGLIPGGKLIEAGPLPAAGGVRDAGVLNLIVSGNTCTTGLVACATVIKEHADGARTADGGNATSTASGTTADARVFPNGTLTLVSDLIRATAVTSNTQVNCQGLTSPFSVFQHKTQNPDPNSTSIATLTVAGINVPILGTPNQVVDIGVAKITLNAQSPYVGSAFGSATSTATPNGGVNQSASASAAIIDFPPTSILAAVVGTGQIILQHSDSSVSGCAPFTVSKTSNGQTNVQANAGTDIPFHVVATNTSGLTCSLLSVTDYLPPQPGEGGVPFTYVSGGPGGTSRVESHPTGNGQNIETFNFAAPPPVPNGGTVAFDLVAHIPSTEPGGTYTQRMAFSSDCGAGSGVFLTGVLTTIVVPGGGAGIPLTGTGLPATGSPVSHTGSAGPSLGTFVLPTALVAGLMLGGLAVVRRRRRPSQGI